MHKMIFLEWLFLTIVTCDAAEPWQLGSQDAATPMMQGIIDLHHDIFFFLILILVFVLWILVRALWHFHYQKNPIPQRIVHGTTIEILRTIFPSIILKVSNYLYFISKFLTRTREKFSAFFNFFCLWLNPYKYKYQLQAKILALFYRNPKLQKALGITKDCLIFLYLIITFIKISNNLHLFLCQYTVLGILPVESQLLEHYLRQPHQDPQWVEFIKIRLETHGLSPAAYEKMFRNFLNTELCFSVREQIIDFYTLLFFNEPDPKLWIKSSELKMIITAHLETLNVEFDLFSLGQILESLCSERQASPFYTGVQSAQAQHFEGFLNQYRLSQGQILEREAFLTQWNDLCRNSDLLAKQNAILKEKIKLLEFKL